MLAAEKIEAAVGKQIHGIDFTFAAVPARSANVIVARSIAGVGADQHSRLFVNVRIDVHHFAVEFDLGVGCRHGRLPGIGKALFQRNEDFVELFIVIGPVRRGAVGAIVVVLAAVGVPARQAAPGWAIDVDTLILVTGGEAGCAAEVGIENAGEERFFAVVAIEPGVIILIAGDNTRPHVTVLGQRALHIGDVALLVPAAVLGGDIAGKLAAGGMLADHVDRCGGVARPGQQAVGAAYDLDPLKKRGIGERVAEVPAGLKPGRNAVDHIVVYLKAAGIIAAAIGVRLAPADPEGIIHHVAEGLQLLILHPLLADDADRLRNIALGHQHFCSGGGGFNAVILPLLVDAGWRCSFYNDGVVGRVGGKAEGGVER
ncbi:Uncharacterised protein [Raoultella terrigena]|uniref:Uncharacterized protein n=1 Tax=Raoultella terrigena TaxID=577 RepID=A0A4U9CWT2_RAOTE|nr:Uncharacterised protein [Raoultella terrigena]